MICPMALCATTNELLQASQLGYCEANFLNIDLKLPQLLNLHIPGLWADECQKPVRAPLWEHWKEFSLQWLELFLLSIMWETIIDYWMFYKQAHILSLWVAY